MTPTQIARRSDALYADGTCGMTRRVLCDMVAQREADLENARAEFDKMDKWHSAELQAEMADNAKLRELLHRLLVEYRYLRVRPRKMYLQHEGRMRAIEEEMRELGVEVDG